MPFYNFFLLVVNCTDPGQVPHAKRRDPPNGIFSFNTNVMYECENGYRSVGIPILTCRANGVWNRPVPSCHLKQCEALPPLENGRILYSDPNRITNTRAEYHCDSGFRLNSLTNLRHCLEGVTWSTLNPNPMIVDSNSSLTNPYECLPVECLAPIRPHNGLRILSLTRKKSTRYLPGDMVIFSCDSAKVKVTAKCQPDGDWTRGIPHCPEPSRCKLPSMFPNGSVEMDSKLNRAVFTCNSGFIMKGVTAVNCLANGVWATAFPNCLPFDASQSQQSSSQNASNEMRQSGLPDNELNKREQTTSKTLAYLLSVIAFVLGLVVIAGAALFCRWRRHKIQHKRWQQYFGHYYHRQSKTNIVMSSTHGTHINRSNRHNSNDSSANAAIPVVSSSGRHLTKSSKHKNANKAPQMLLQSSFSSSDDNASEIKSLHMDALADRARTISTYADDTCPEDEFDDDDDDVYISPTDYVPPSTTTAMATARGHHPPLSVASRRQHNSLPPPNTMPMIALGGLSQPPTPPEAAKRTLSSNSNHAQYSNHMVPTNSSPYSMMSPGDHHHPSTSTVPVTDL